MTVSEAELDTVEERLSTTIEADANAACAYCGWRSGLMTLPEARRSARTHALECSVNPLRQQIAALEEELRRWRGWAAERLMGTREPEGGQERSE